MKQQNQHGEILKVASWQRGEEISSSGIVFSQETPLVELPQ
jgi:hypothetical protein